MLDERTMRMVSPPWAGLGRLRITPRTPGQPSEAIVSPDNEQRVTMAGKPVEWELSVVAPGIYRWRATDWQRHEVNSVVGIRCQVD